MALLITNTLAKNSVKLLEERLLALTISYNSKREHIRVPYPKLRNPTWFVPKERKSTDEPITSENREFLKEVVQDRYLSKEPIIQKELLTDVEWKANIQRTGLIARKIGVYPMWLKNGKRITTTLLQVLDNHVIKYTPPGEYTPTRKKVGRIYNEKGCLLLGAGPVDPANYTKEYCGLFKDSGVIPKKYLCRFFVSKEGALPPGTLLNALHFKVGEHVDVRGLTIDRGFQGVVVRHGFKGMPASHGVTKTHRRGGNIGAGGEKGRVWPGTKMPGHMGNRWRILRALKIWRINTKYNVLYVSGQNVPGEVNSICYVFDSKVWGKRPMDIPYPTYVPTDEEVPEDIYDKDVHQFGESSIIFK